METKTKNRKPSGHPSDASSPATPGVDSQSLDGPPSLLWGNVLVAIGVVGLAATVLVVALGLRTVDRTGVAVTRSLELTADAIVAVEASVSAAGDSVTIAADGLDALGSAAQNTGDSLSGVAGLADDTAAALGTEIPAAIDAIRTTMPSLIESAELIEDALGALSFLGVGFDPERPPAASLRDLDSSLGDVAAVLEDGSGQLSTIGDDLAELESDLAALTMNIDQLDANVERAAALVDTYATTTAGIALLVDETAADLESQRREGQLIVILFGLLLALLNVVPIGLGVRHRRAFRKV